MLKPFNTKEQIEAATKSNDLAKLVEMVEKRIEYCHENGNILDEFTIGNSLLLSREGYCAKGALRNNNREKSEYNKIRTSEEIKNDTTTLVEFTHINLNDYLFTCKHCNQITTIKDLVDDDIQPGQYHRSCDAKKQVSESKPFIEENGGFIFYHNELKHNIIIFPEFQADNELKDKIRHFIGSSYVEPNIKNFLAIHVVTTGHPREIAEIALNHYNQEKQKTKTKNSSNN